MVLILYRFFVVTSGSSVDFKMFSSKGCPTSLKTLAVYKEPQRSGSIYLLFSVEARLKPPPTWSRSLFSVPLHILIINYRTISVDSSRCGLHQRDVGVIDPYVHARAKADDHSP